MATTQAANLAKIMVDSDIATLPTSSPETHRSSA